MSAYIETKEIRLFKGIKEIFKNNKFHSRIVLTALMIEYITNDRFIVLPLNFVCKIFRKLIIQVFYNCELRTKSFFNLESITSLRLPHPFLIIVHENSKIGKNVTIFHNVTIGVIEGDERFRLAPVIEDNVYIGTGTSILGKVHIARSCKVGCHSLILKSIEKEGLTIVGLHK